MISMLISGTVSITIAILNLIVNITTLLIIVGFFGIPAVIHIIGSLFN